MVAPAGLEPAISSLRNWCLVLLGQGAIGAYGETRTHYLILTKDVHFLLCYEGMMTVLDLNQRKEVS